MQRYFQVAGCVTRSHDVHIFVWCTGVVAIWRVCLEILNHSLVPILTSPNMPFISHSFNGGFLRWVNYDSAWYLKIIRHGYVITHNLHGQETIAFFPVYPVTVRVLSRVLHTPEIGTGIVLNLVLLCVTVYFVYKLSELLAEKTGYKDKSAIAKFGVLLLMLNPASIFFASLYADVILVLAMTASTYFALKDSYFIAAAFAGVAAGTKSIGIVLVPVLVIMYAQAHWEDIKNWDVIIKKHIPRLVAIGLLAASGLIMYVIYLWHRFSDPFLFIKIEKYWARSPSLHAAAYSIWVKYLELYHVHDWFSNINLSEAYLAAIPIFFAIFGVYLLIRHRLQYAWLVVLCAIVIAMPLSTGELASLNRYVLGLTPVIAYVSVYFYTNKYLKPIMLTAMWVSATLLVIFSTSFLSGYFMG